MCVIDISDVGTGQGFDYVPGRCPDIGHLRLATQDNGQTPCRELEVTCPSWAIIRK